MIGILVWTYIPIKIFVADVDRIFLSAVAPGALPLLDYRLVFYVAVAAAAALFLRRWWLYAAYVVFFPFVVVFWKMGRFFVRHRSWAMLLGMLQAVSALFGDFRYNLVTKALA